MVFDSSSSDCSLDTSAIKTACETDKNIINYVYIDDFNAVETLNLKQAMSHITTNKCSMDVRAIKSERLFSRVHETATEIGMLVNGAKTQMLCIHPCIFNSVNTHINCDNNEIISSTNDLKILGFTFDQRPNANKHVELLVQRFYSKLWSLRFLKRSGLDKGKLLELYNSNVRSAVEYCSTVYHSMINEQLAERLESVQRQALRIIFGWDCDIREIMAAKNIETLKSRREKAVLNFALKNEHSGRFGKRWFKKNENIRRNELRQSTRKEYLVPRCRTDRMFNNPVVNMTMTLNKHYSN